MEADRVSELKCGSCGGELDGRYCGDCGADSQAIRPQWPSDSPRSTPPFEQSSSLSDVPIPIASRDNSSIAPPGLISIGQLLDDGWHGLTRNVGDWVINFIVAGIVLGTVGALFFAYDWLITDETGSGNFTFTTKHPIRPLEILLILVLLVAVVFVVYAFDQAALRVARGQRPIVNDVWSPHRLLPYLVMAIIVGAVGVVSWIVPFAGPILIGAVLLYAPFHVLDGRGSGVTSLFKSISMATQQSLVARQVLFSFILGAFSLLGLGIAAIGIQIANAAGADTWSTKWRDAAAILLLAVAGIVYLIALATTRISAALAYIRLDEASATREQY